MPNKNSIIVMACLLGMPALSFAQDAELIVDFRKSSEVIPLIEKSLSSEDFDDATEMLKSAQVDGAFSAISTLLVANCRYWREQNHDLRPRADFSDLTVKDVRRLVLRVYYGQPSFADLPFSVLYANAAETNLPCE